MGRLSNKKVNTPRIAFEDYFWVIAGVPKAGKTSLYAYVCEEYFGSPEEAMILAFEKGYSSLKVKAEDIADWDDFEELVDDLVENKEEYGLKMLCIDTIDVMMDMATDSVIAEWNAKNSKKRTTDIGGVGAKGNSDSGFGVGHAQVKKKVRKAVDRLMKCGYGIVAICHSKDKKVEQKDGVTYDQLGLSISASASEVFVNMADFVVFITVDKVKEGKGMGEKRYIHFRSDSFVSIAGSRFKHVPEKIEYDVKGFLDVFNKAVQAEFDSGTDLGQIKKEQVEKREKAAQEFIEQEKAKSSASDLHAEIKELISQLAKSEQDMVGSHFKETLGKANYTKVDDINLLEDALKFVKDLVGVDEEDFGEIET